ncbi:MAG: CotH kinase family protein, partial [Myxococcota bacterium]|nr:CotH kinase family protein [Myxococcota bacterium]
MRIAAKPRAPRASLRPGRRAAIVIAGVAAWSGLIFAIGAATHAAGFYGIFVRPLVEGGLATPFVWARAQLATPPRLEIDLGFEDYQKLAFQREKALRESALFASEDDYVPAVIRSGAEDVKVKMRLKGDSPGHLQGEKWSFRVDVKGDHTLRGLDRFSLQHPSTRNYLGEWIYHRALEREDVLALRYEFVDLVLNGKPLGVYAVEEHFEKQLVERNRRREGPLLRFDEELMWRQIHEQGPFGAASSDYGAYEASAVDGFKTGQIMADPAAREVYLHAVRLLEAFRRGALRTSDVFDAKRLATYFALTDLLGAEHGSRWHNIRFYFNPVTARLEPIGFDAEITELTSLSSADLVLRDFAGRQRVMERPFNAALFADRDFHALYLAELERVAEPAYLDALLRDLGPELEEATRFVQREFPQIRVPEPLLRRNQAYLRSMLDPVAAVRANLRGIEAGSLELEVGNLQTLPVEVLGVEIADAAGLPAQIDLPAPLALAPRNPGELVRFEPARVVLPQGVDPAALASAALRWRMLGSQRVRGAPIASASPLPASGEPWDSTQRPPNLDRFPFVRVAGAVAEIQPGTWAVEETLVVPAGLVLRAGPGVRLDLRSGAKIVSRSPLAWRGEAGAPVEVFSSDATGQGLVVIGAGAESTLEHVRFQGLAAADEPGWTLTGAVTFYESPVSVLHGEFTANPAEDALNGIRTRVRIDQTLFRDAASDAFDCDFCDVEITNARFENPTNDGIDVSGSTARVDNVVVEGAGDKGISTGEASDLVATRVRVVGANV